MKGRRVPSRLGNAPQAGRETVIGTAAFGLPVKRYLQLPWRPIPSLFIFA